MKKGLLFLITIVVLLAFPMAAFAEDTPPGPPEDVGFDEFGYNYQANIFIGKADGVDRNLDGTVGGVATYAEDHLVMKWSQGWDAARFEGEDWDHDAWLNNNWNGKKPGGSGEIWHNKIDYSAVCDAGEVPDGNGGCIWRIFEEIQSHGTVDNEHEMIYNDGGYGEEH